MSTAANPPDLPPIEVPCPQCAVPADQESLRCPSCREDLAVLVRLRYAGRIDYNEALAQLRGGDAPAAQVLLRRALTTEPDLRPALALLADLTGARVAPAARTEAADHTDAAARTEAADR